MKKIAFFDHTQYLISESLQQMLKFVQSHFPEAPSPFRLTYSFSKIIRTNKDFHQFIHNLQHRILRISALPPQDKTAVVPARHLLQSCEECKSCCRAKLMFMRASGEGGAVCEECLRESEQKGLWVVLRGEQDLTLMTQRKN